MDSGRRGYEATVLDSTKKRTRSTRVAYWSLTPPFVTNFAIPSKRQRCSALSARLVSSGRKWAAGGVVLLATLLLALIVNGLHNCPEWGAWFAALIIGVAIIPAEVWNGWTEK